MAGDLRIQRSLRCAQMVSTNAKRPSSFIMRAERAEFCTLSIVLLTSYFPTNFHLWRIGIATSFNCRSNNSAFPLHFLQLTYNQVPQRLLPAPRDIAVPQLRRTAAGAGGIAAEHLSRRIMHQLIAHRARRSRRGKIIAACGSPLSRDSQYGAVAAPDSAVPRAALPLPGQRMRQLVQQRAAHHLCIARQIVLQKIPRQRDAALPCTAAAQTPDGAIRAITPPCQPQRLKTSCRPDCHIFRAVQGSRYRTFLRLQPSVTSY